MTARFPDLKTGFEDIVDVVVKLWRDGGNAGYLGFENGVNKERV
jgi:hypothetical protein